MSRKPKFKPVITRVKLNPEQAVLSCSCYSVGFTVKSPADKAIAIPPFFTACVGKDVDSGPPCQGPAVGPIQSGTPGGSVASS